MAAPQVLDTKRYDRQIRLWGMETQLRMTNTRVLLCGAGGLGAEISKNLVLAGVGFVTIADLKVITENDVHCGGQFLLSTQDIGKNRAEASLAFLRGLNPSVKLESEAADACMFSADKLAKFDIIIATELSLEAAAQLNTRAREGRSDPEECLPKRARNGTEGGVPDVGAHAGQVGFIAADAVGLYGYAFLDLGKYNFVESSKSRNADGEECVTSTQQQIIFVPMEDALTHLKRAKQPGDLAKVLVAADAYRSRKSVADSAMSLGLALEELGDLGAITNNMDTALAPLCAVLGGLVGQEVVKIISKKDVPIDNFLGLDCVAPPPKSGGRVLKLRP